MVNIERMSRESKLAFFKGTIGRIVETKELLVFFNLLYDYEFSGTGLPNILVAHGPEFYFTAAPELLYLSACI
ncbi:hypothetical protein TSUD_237250 [Trifolium subterraneum]|uniref:Uncharacterized protein n=1 Tax=Trifolium subterraneum TaxID=3900 RepID=A0A2Z6NZR0_TRISU|nr:hypothetical protein TSUD_237250 [Trifolium subterraneum]